MNVQRRKQVAELAAKLHPIMLEAKALAEAELSDKRGVGVVIEPKHPYYADEELAIATAELAQTLDLLLSFPTIGAAR